VTPGARIAAAIEILAAIDEGGRPADDIAADYFRRRRYIGAKDRAQIAAHVYVVLRHRAAIDWWITRALGPFEGRDLFRNHPKGRSMDPRLRG
jgi:16S rRNA (cytosine967-C5)-methyltransferase